MNGPLEESPMTGRELWAELRRRRRRKEKKLLLVRDGNVGPGGGVGRQEGKAERPGCACRKSPPSLFREGQERVQESSRTRFRAQS